MTVIAWIGLAGSALIALGISFGLLKLQRRMLGAEPTPQPERLTTESSGDEQPRRLEGEG